MRTVKTSAFDLAQRFIGLDEVRGVASNPQILAMLRLDQNWPAGDEVMWCSAYVNYIAWLLRLPRSKSLRARSWLGVGEPISLAHAEAGFDVVILKRGHDPQPGPDDINAPGHVGFFAGLDPAVIGSEASGAARVMVLGGNQGDAVSFQTFPVSSILGIRRLA